MRKGLLLDALVVWKMASGSSSDGTSRLQIHIPKSLNKANGYDHRDALFGIPPYGASIQQQVYYADSTLCDAAVDNSKGYPERPMKNGKMEGWAAPFILMVDRGECTFVQKVRNAQHAGAAAVLIADNSCLCTFPDCPRTSPEEPCEADEPLMSDDGSGSDITIPSFLVFKQDAEPIKEALKANTQVRAEMSFAMPAPDAQVEYELWTTPTDTYSQNLEQGFKEAAVALGEKAKFTPHMYIYDGLRAGCDYGGVNECFNLCTNHGRYCAIDPDDDLDSGISGADVVKESLRRICVWKSYGSDGIGRPYWNYVDEFLFRCYQPAKPDLFRDDNCVSDAMEHAGVDKAIVDNCMATSGGLEGDVENSMLQSELRAKDSVGVILIPTFFVNSAPVRGQLSFATAFKAICAGYAQGSEPQVCSHCAACNDEAGCVKDGKCTTGYSSLAALSTGSGVSISAFIGSLALFGLIFASISYALYKHQQRHMRDQVRGIVAQYMPLELNREPVDTSVGLADDDHQFTIT